MSRFRRMFATGLLVALATNSILLPCHGMDEDVLQNVVFSDEHEETRDIQYDTDAGAAGAGAGGAAAGADADGAAADGGGGGGGGGGDDDSDMDFTIHMGKDPREMATHHESASIVPVEAITLQDDHIRDGYTGTLSLRVAAFGEEWILDLLNNPISAKVESYFHQGDDDDVADNMGAYDDDVGLVPKKRVAADCHYHGRIRHGHPESWVVASTCHGLIAKFWDGNETYTIAPMQMKLWGKHIMYRGCDMKPKTPGTCGAKHADGQPEMSRQGSLDEMAASMLGDTHARMKRQTILTEGRQRVVEMFIVADNRFYAMFNRNDAVTVSYIEAAINQMDLAYRTINFRVVMVNLILFNQRDAFFVTFNPNALLRDFTNYIDSISQNISVSYDAAQFLTGIDLSGSTIGIAAIGEICMPEGASVVQQRTTDEVADTAIVMAHELGHNLNMLHENGRSCDNCPGNEPCIMSSHVSPNQLLLFSQCALDDFDILTSAQHSCLALQAECGNGFVDDGEDCDCGDPAVDECNNPCCDQMTCKLTSTAQCAHGACCNLASCMPMTKDTVCRAASINNTCDIEDTCDGVTGQCADSRRRNGLSCPNSPLDLCWEGKCVTRQSQCETLFGQGAGSGSELCYARNVDGTSFGNCGVSILFYFYTYRYLFARCQERDALCGKLWCNEGGSRFARLPYSVSTQGFEVGRTDSRQVFSCKGAMVLQNSFYLTHQQDTYTLVNDGQSCGEDMVCLDQRCVDLDNAANSTQCPYHNGLECNEYGACDQFGDCHCQAGFSGAACETDIDDCVDVKCLNGGTCQDGINMFKCLCPKDYAGTLCEQMDQCALSPDACAEYGKNGVCINDDSGQSFVCGCRHGFTGTPCENIDECKASAAAATPATCSVNAECLDSEGSYECVCGSGYTGDGATCTDVNECYVGNYELCPRESDCNNTIGSFVCTCMSGYTGNGASCLDVDECSLSPNEICQPYGQCNNTHGSFVCDCVKGAKLVAYSNQCVDIDECENRYYGPTQYCDYRSNCTNSPLSFDCNGCRSGYKGDGSPGNCSDIDECALGLHMCTNGFVCNNYYGGFSCRCPSGYRINTSSGRCEDRNECLENYYRCYSNSVCVNVPGRYRCECEPGFRQLYGRQPYIHCYDIDECSVGADDCDNTTGHISCYNTHGSFLCACSPGFVQVNGSADANETSSVQPTLSPFVPFTSNPFVTNAPPIVNNDPDKCVDVDECALGYCLPHGTCSNSVGSYNCSCVPGSVLRSGRCVDRDECDFGNRFSRQFCDPNANCTNTQLGYECDGCRDGYEGDGTPGNCMDVNECVDGLHECTNGFQCRNVQGGFYCHCPYGYRINSSGYCNDRDECLEYYRPCFYDDVMCVNTPGSFSCQCEPGFRQYGYRFGRYNRCFDINECSSGADDCLNDTTLISCYNTQGSYRCACSPGYEVDNQTAPTLPAMTATPSAFFTTAPSDENHNDPDLCVDRDECDQGYCTPYGNCTNTQGSHICSCSDGAEERGGQCLDRNECSDQHRGRFCDLKAFCVNTHLSYACSSCFPGYHGDGSAGSCVDYDECANASLVGLCREEHGGVCINTAGSYFCICLPGYQRAGSRCVDINECYRWYTVSRNCDARSTCVNTVGSFVCQCRPGYTGPGWRSYYDYSYRGCEDINECEDPAVMDTCSHGTVECVNTPGSYSCQCKAGFQPDDGGSSSDLQCTDQNECEITVFCHPHGNCTNTVGSYECNCQQGATQVSVLCLDINECDFKAYGERYCDRNSNCSNSVLGYDCGGCRHGFHKAEGRCTDLDECQDEGISLCAEQNYTTCLNTPGSFLCGCDVGYSYSSSLGACTDVDECSTYFGYRCYYRATCRNTPGSFECDCDPGWTGNGYSCSPLNRCRVPELNPCNGTAEICVDRYYGNVRCDCLYGFRREGSDCVDIDECVEQIACQPYGNCTNYPGYFACDCAAGAENERCVDRDECSPHYRSSLLFCDENANCTNTPLSYECHGCLTGYTGDGSVGSCVDVDECALGTDGCNVTGGERCVNTHGSFHCDCLTGFVFDASLGECTDLNECSYSNRYRYCSYSASCRNTHGSYLCNCSTGLMFDGRACIDVDECGNGTETLRACTARNQTCRNYNGGYSCQCSLGYELSSYGGDGGVCADVNECLKYGACRFYGTCTNTEGSYTCDCVNGSEVLYSRHCHDINECSYSYRLENRSCDRYANCENTELGYRCLGCQRGFTGSGLPGDCIDINECLLPANSCSANTSNASGTCQNTLGSFSCSCPLGFRSSNGRCVDLDECSRYFCHTHADCNNTYGSFSCECRTGYSGNGRVCYDVNECLNDTLNNCTGFGIECVNLHATPPGFACRCAAGYRTAADGSCVDVDECTVHGACRPYGTCTNTVGGYNCTCREGSEHTGYSCADRNECSHRHFYSGLYCDHNANCVNYNLGYICAGCQTGYRGSGLPGNCTRIDYCAERQHQCNGTNEVCRSSLYGTINCGCRQGYSRRNGTCTDYDECEYAYRCGSANVSTCINTPGSFRCECAVGFKYQQLPVYDYRYLCLDIDECALGIHNCSDAVKGRSSGCNNTLGSYRCNCSTGYAVSVSSHDGSQACSDIDECTAGTHDCAGGSTFCRNTDGGFACPCSPGYVASAGGDGSACLPADCRAVSRSCTPLGECVLRSPNDNNNNTGSYECECQAGAELIDQRCVDVDECSRSSSSSNGDSPPCQANASCWNTRPGFECLCSGGFHASTGTAQFNDGRLECIDTDECAQRGTNNCDASGRATCANHIGTYSCSCRMGFLGNGLQGSCQDVDECNSETHGCDLRLTYCQNSPGSYTCPCRDGFTQNLATGACTDQDECAGDSHSCGRNTRCANTLGSYDCPCLTGFNATLALAASVPPQAASPSPRLRQCSDVDECQLMLRNCSGDNVECSNTPGSSRCDCLPGFYRDDGAQCADVQVLVNTSAFSAPAEPSSTTLTWEVKPFQDMRLTLYQIIVVHLGQPDMAQVLDLLRVSPDDLFPVGSDKIQSYAKLVNVAIAPDNPRAHIAAVVTLDMLRSEEFTIGNDLPASVAGSNVRNGPLEPNVMYTLFYRGLSDGQRGKRQVDPGTDRLVQTSSFQPLQMTDVDECNSETHGCDLRLTYCQNSPGSYTCPCRDGFTQNLATGACTDLDECAGDSNSCGSNTRCANTLGSYDCPCLTGFNATRALAASEPPQAASPSPRLRQCSDVDECSLGVHGCGVNTQCANTDGSYACACTAGFTGNAVRASGRDCYDIDDCELGVCDAVSTTCRNSDGAFSCRCRHGFVPYAENTTHCSDVDECQLMIQNCSGNPS
ncbi:fibrillin-3-like [Sycon ciliatum]|uniref:fibrillin-3-like n=1 Tax=Sycon ciliatum TaxID=27933 RepID=UPI0031F6A5C0